MRWTKKIKKKKKVYGEKELQSHRRRAHTTQRLTIYAVYSVSVLLPQYVTYSYIYENMHTTQMWVLCVFADEKILIKHSLKLAFDFLINVSKSADIIELAFTTTTPLHTYCSREFVFFLFWFYVFFLDRVFVVRSLVVIVMVWKLIVDEKWKLLFECWTRIRCSRRTYAYRPESWRVGYLVRDCAFIS